MLFADERTYTTSNRPPEIKKHAVLPNCDAITLTDKKLINEPKRFALDAIPIIPPIFSCAERLLNAVYNVGTIAPRKMPIIIRIGKRYMKFGTNN